MYSTYDIFDDVLKMRNIFDNYFVNTPTFRRVVEYPYVNVYEKDDVLELMITIPGGDEKNLDLKLVDNSLQISGEKKSDYEDKPYIRKERNFGKFKKSIKLPYKVDPDKIEATMKNGILTVHLVKSDDIKPKKIEIN